MKTTIEDLFAYSIVIVITFICCVSVIFTINDISVASTSDCENISKVWLAYSGHTLEESNTRLFDYRVQNGKRNIPDDFKVVESLILKNGGIQVLSNMGNKRFMYTYKYYVIFYCTLEGTGGNHDIIVYEVN